MDASSWILLGTAASIGLLHTVIGVDHTLPFVVLARSQRWGLRKLWLVTGLCGIGHVLSSVVIGAIGIGAGVGVERVTHWDTSRGGVAAWLLVSFGIAYAIWGIYRSQRGSSHTHPHVHEDGTTHVHEHDHLGRHLHVHGERTVKSLTVMGLMVVLVLGPCEPLIPLLAAPAFAQDWAAVAAILVAFGGVTVAAMLALVTVGWYGMRWSGLQHLERHMHTFAGVAIAASGLAITWLGI